MTTASALTLNPAVAEALKSLGLTTLAKVVPAVLETARQEQWSYEMLLQQAVGTELAGRAERAYQRRVRAAHLPTVKSLEGFDFAFQPSLSTRLIQELGTLGFLQTATNIEVAPVWETVHG